MNSDIYKDRCEESLREASAFGDEEGVRVLLDSGVDINSQHSINGWTALHWASKRGHTQLVRLLLSKGADAYLTSVYGETALSLASQNEIQAIFSEISGSPIECQEKPRLPITPNYLSNPALAPKIEKKEGRSSEDLYYKPLSVIDVKRKLAEELVLKVRIADSFDKDFIETEVPMDELTYENVCRICCEEMNIDSKDVLKIRKLPNTIVRKDKDVLRLQNFQELELVLKNAKSATQTLKNHQSHSSEDANRNVHSKDNNSGSISPSVKKSNFKNGTILY